MENAGAVQTLHVYLHGRELQQVACCRTTFEGTVLVAYRPGYLFALVAYVAEQRTREIGIRKVLGATPASIVVLINKDLVRLSLKTGTGLLVKLLLYMDLGY